MPFTTLTGADDLQGELVGYGPIPADLAREIAADGVWKRLITDPLSGALLDHGRTTYRPPAALADYVRARDVHCRFPTCRRRAIDADLDHLTAFHTHGGATSALNLWGACPHHHHRLKHHGGWQVLAHPDGRLEWIAPTGHRHLSDPHDYRPDPTPAERAAARAPTPPPDPGRPPVGLDHLGLDHLGPGDLAPGHLAPGDLAPGDLAPGDLAPGDLAPGHLAPDDPDPPPF